jgi:hypothetical protein
MTLRYVPDKTGRFRLRPHYDPADLDHECEMTISAFMREICGDFTLPIPTDVLTKLIERDAQYLDLYADLSEEEGNNVEGVTDFQLGDKPIVRISGALSAADYRSHRLRTTLTHEYGHVKFHDYLYQTEDRTGDLFPDAFVRRPLKCKRDNMLDAPFVDWMEWQAGYVCGALLMPASSVRRLVSDYREESNLSGMISGNSKEGRALIDRVAHTCDVSEDAARVRLLKLRYLALGKTTNALY